MIYLKGNMPPLKDQILEAKKWADESFCSTATKGFMESLPKFGDMIPNASAILLSLKNVEPHDDTWQGKVTDDGIDGPPVRHSFFWLLKSTKPIHVMVGTQFKKLYPGDFILFDDSVLHCVVAESKWLGAAWQLQPADYDKDPS